jgi:putative hydrolase of the HAD superfamily
MGRITTIFWDCGGVLLTNGWDHVERRAVLDHFDVTGADFEDFEQRHPGPNDEWEKGRITVEEYLRLTLFTKTRSFTPQEFMDVMKLQSKVLHEMNVQILRELAAAGRYKLVMLNNEAAELNDYRIATFGLRDMFGVFCSSCYVGLRKPGLEMFKLGLQLMQANPAESVFVDDRAGNAAAAASLGMKAIHFTTPGQLGNQLQAAGVELV